MVRGLDHFTKYFRHYSENFILVGGVASHLLLEDAGAARVRPTKDLDILVIMKPSDDFLNALKDYTKLGGYEIQMGKNGKAAYYRFQKPESEEFPVMIELFSVAHSDQNLFVGQHIIPIPNSTGVQSLSAILLDNEYYAIIRKNAVERGGINILNPLALIPFKAKAYLDIKERGEDSKNWKKHRSDIINLAVTFLTEESREELNGGVRSDFLKFIEQLKLEITTDIIVGSCGQDVDREEVIRLLESTFL